MYFIIKHHVADSKTLTHGTNITDSYKCKYLYNTGCMYYIFTPYCSVLKGKGISALSSNFCLRLKSFILKAVVPYWLCNKQSIIAEGIKFGQYMQQPTNYLIIYNNLICDWICGKGSSTHIYFTDFDNS